MILWLASYPKSGNTWVRTILAQILYSNFDSEKVIETSKKIRLYPSKKDFLELDEDFKLSIYPPEKKKVILDKTISNWDISQNKINLNNEINIFKTHNMLCKIPLKDKEYAFTNIKNTIGVIHVVRDPRNVITSLINHFSFESEEQAINFLTNENQTIGLEDNLIPQILSSWSNHFMSWKRFPKNNHLIRYEDLIQNPKIEIERLFEFLKNFFKVTITKDDINKIILNSSFENLKKLETKGLFDENAISKKTGNIKNFFNLGKENDWKKLIQTKTSNQIEKNFQNEMKVLGYI